jgi:hypothetical protein
MSMKVRHFARVGSALAALFAAANAEAVIATPSSSPKTAMLGGTRSQNDDLSEKDVPPALAAPNVDPDVVERNGGAARALYARAGALELGGFANFAAASNFTSIQVSPTAGIFIFDHFELSAIIGINYVHQTAQGPAGEQTTHKTVVRILGEPSYHLPLARTIWAFLGVGLGVASVPREGGETITGFDIAPRIGAKFLVGRSGLFTPALFADYTTGGSIQTSDNRLLGVSTIYGIQAGYTVMW